MDRKTFKSKPFHVITDSKNGDIKRIITPGDLDVGTEALPADLKIYGGILVNSIKDTDGNPYVFGAQGSPDPYLSGFRLCGSSTDPLADTSTFSTLHFRPMQIGTTTGYITLWDDTAWILREGTSASLVLSDMTTNSLYDIYAYWTGSAIAIELSSAWAGVNTPPTYAYQNGVKVKNGDATRKYVGTIRATNSASTIDNTAQRFVWNKYNQRRRTLSVTDATISWAGGTAATWRQARASSANQLEYVCGESVDVQFSTQSMGSCTAAAAHFQAGIGIDSTTTNSAQLGAAFANSANVIVTPVGSYWGSPSNGYHYIAWLEYHESGTGTWYGGSPASQRTCGISGTVLG